MSGLKSCFCGVDKVLRCQLLAMARKKLSTRSYRALESNQGDIGHLAAPKAVTGSGQCSPGLCGQEAACKYVAANNTYLCICPHDSSPPTAELRCPNRLTVPLTPRPIHNIIPPTGVNSTNASLPFVSGQSHHEVAAEAGSRSIVAALSGALIMVAMAGILTVLLALVVICWWRRKNFTRHNDKQLANGTPVSLTKGFLEPDRYTANPQYTPCYGPEAQQLVSFTAPILPREQITFSQEIGQGCFGKVYRGELIEGEEVKTVAVKVLKEAATKEAEEDFMREVEIMSAFKHPNILSLRGITLKEPGRSPCMVFEYMHYGDLTEVLRRNGRHFWKPTSGALHLSKESLLSIALQIASGMRYLAAQRFVHRDLACRNCLVGESLIVKIADFGMSRDVYTCDYYKVGGSRLLPVRWMSPESVLYGRFTLESDVWSFGIVLWEIFSLGKQPYFGHSNEEVVKLILQGIILIPPEDCPTVICELMRSCWKTEPRDRMRFTEIYDRLMKSTPVESVPAEALPRPPAFTIGLNGTAPTLDAEDYLRPHPSIIREYLQPLPD